MGLVVKLIGLCLQLKLLILPIGCQSPSFITVPPVDASLIAGRALVIVITNVISEIAYLMTTLGIGYKACGPTMEPAAATATVASPP
jgi:hypothetical protein